MLFFSWLKYLFLLLKRPACLESRSHTWSKETFGWQDRAHTLCVTADTMKFKIYPFYGVEVCKRSAAPTIPPTPWKSHS
jgi:hypothetical protein